MNDDHDPGLDVGWPESPGADDEHVRDLLAGLGAEPTPVPSAVAARLEETLAALVAERAAAQPVAAGTSTGSSTGSSTGTVVPLPSRWWPRVAAAAAAVIVLGGGALVAAGVLGHGSGVDSSASSVATEKSASGGHAGGQSAAQPSGAATAAPPSADTQQRHLDAATAGLPQLSSTTLAADVRALLARRPALREQARSPAPTSAPAVPPSSCPGPGGTAGATTTPVLLDGGPALLVVRPAAGGSRTVEVWACSGQRRLATTTVAP